MKNTTTLTLAAALLGTVAACTDRAALARSDSLLTELNQQQVLADRLASQKDSLMRVVLDADSFIGTMDSAISSVRGMPKGKKSGAADPIAAQLQARKEVQARVQALVARANQTAAELAALRKNETENVELRKKTEADAQLIVDMTATIERQRNELASLGARLDTLSNQITVATTKLYKAYYVVGTEKELRDKGIVVREGGTNLLVAKVGRTLVPARVLDTTAFTPIDQRSVKTIALADSLTRYRIVSRQSLDDAEVEWRNGNEFRGDLKITDPDEFWAASRFLILVKQ